MVMARKTGDELLKLPQVCEMLKVHPNTLRSWDKKGILKAVRFGVRGDRRYKLNDIIKITKQK